MTETDCMGSTEISDMVDKAIEKLIEKWKRDGRMNEAEELFMHSRFIYLFGLECVFSGYIKGLNCHKEKEK